MFGLEKRLDERLAQAGEKFNAILAYLLGEGQSDDAYRVEVRLFRDLLALGLLLLVLWFLKKLGGDVGKTIVTEEDEVLRRERLKSRPILTVFGELRVPRWYYHKDGSSGVFPLDEKVNLPEAIPSYYVQELVEQRTARMPYDEALTGNWKSSARYFGSIRTVFSISRTTRIDFTSPRLTCGSSPR